MMSRIGTDTKGRGTLAAGCANSRRANRRESPPNSVERGRVHDNRGAAQFGDRLHSSALLPAEAISSVALSSSKSSGLTPDGTRKPVRYQCVGGVSSTSCTRPASRASSGSGPTRSRRSAWIGRSRTSAAFMRRLQSYSDLRTRTHPRATPCGHCPSPIGPGDRHTARRDAIEWKRTPRRTGVLYWAPCFPRRATACATRRRCRTSSGTRG